MQELICELKGEGELLHDLPDGIEEEEEGGRAILLRDQRGVPVTKTEGVSSFQPLSLNQLCKPLNRGTGESEMVRVLVQIPCHGPGVWVQEDLSQTADLESCVQPSCSMDHHTSSCRGRRG